MAKVSPTGCCVVVADARRARLFRLDFPSRALIESQTLVNPQARLHESEFHSDRQGRAFDSGSPGRHAMEASGGRDHANDEFAREVADVLRKGRVDHQYTDLVIVAAPRFLGLLRGHLDGQTAKLVRSEVSREVTANDPSSLFDLVAGEVSPRYAGSPDANS